MMCKKPELSEKLVLFIENMLPGEEHKEIGAHLEECEGCRDEEQALRANISLLKEGARLESTSKAITPCPDEDSLVTYQEAPENLSVKERRRIESHLKRCGDCREALSLLTDLSLGLPGDQALPSPVKMPLAIRKAAENLYGRPHKEGLIDRVLSIFQVRPSYSLLSALAVTLIIVGVLSLVFNDLTYQKASHVSYRAATDSHKTDVPAAPGEVMPAAGPAGTDEGMGGRRAASRDKTKTFTASAPQKEKEQAAGFNEEKTQTSVAQSKDKSIELTKADTSRTNSALTRQASPHSSSGVPPVSTENQAYGGFSPSTESGNLAASHEKPVLHATGTLDLRNTALEKKTETMNKGGCNGGHEYDLKENKKITIPADGLNGADDDRHQPNPPSAATGRVQAEHPPKTALGNSTKTGQGMGGNERSEGLSKLSEDKKAAKEREMSTTAQACIDKILGPGSARIVLIVIAEEKNEPSGKKRVEVTVESARPLSRNLQTEVKRSLLTSLKLEEHRDMVKFTHKDATTH
jgi:hypothetical protein